MSSNNNMLVALIGLSALIFTFQTYNQKNVVEHFGMNPKQMVSVERVAQQSPKTGDVVTVPGTFQAILNPRQAGMVDYGAFIRYNMPSKEHRADSMGSLSYANMVSDKSVEGYCGGGACNTAGCRAGGTNDTSIQTSQSLGTGSVKTSNAVPSGFASPSYAQQFNKLNYNETTDTLPVQGMGTAANALGQATVQPIIYDRYIYANQKNHLYALGDPIRGDLPIVPLSKGWFSPAATPQSMLRDSALMVMGGTDNETTKELMALKTAVSGGSLDTGSGINYGVQKSSFASGDGTLKVTSFP
jgi:hypothetical protein